MTTGFMGQIRMKGFEYYKCLAVQGTSMILTFTIFGVYLDGYLAKIY